MSIFSKLSNSRLSRQWRSHKSSYIENNNSRKWVGKRYIQTASTVTAGSVSASVTATANYP